MSTLRDLLIDYARIKERLDEARGRSGDRASRPFPAASSGEIAELERRLGGPVPLSYRAFLERHDGWARFWGAMWIAGASGEARRHVDDQLRHWKRHAQLGSPDHADLEIDGKRYWVIGADDNGGFLALGERRADGERPVYDVPRGFVENEWPSFDDFVRAQHRFRANELGQLSDSPEATRAAQDRPTIRVRTLDPIEVSELDGDDDAAPTRKPPARTPKRPVKRPAKAAKTKVAKPAKTRPAKKTPAKKRPAKKTPAKKRPAKKTPAKKRPAKQKRGRRS